MDKYSNTQVRRQDRLLAEEQAIDLLTNGEYGILSMVEMRVDIPSGYGIPINYVWDGYKYIYLHCAPQGHKLNCIDTYPQVSFCVIGKTNIVSRKFTTGYESIIVRALAHRHLSIEQRTAALRLFIEKYSPEDVELGMKYAEKSFHRTEIIRLEIESISGKSKVVNT